MNLTDEAIIEFTGKEMIIRPAEQEVVDFSIDILKDLVAKDLSEDELIQEFARIKASIPQALDKMVQEALNHSIVAESLGDYLDSLDEDEDE